MVCLNLREKKILYALLVDMVRWLQVHIHHYKGKAYRRSAYQRRTLMWCVSSKYPRRTVDGGSLLFRLPETHDIGGASRIFSDRARFAYQALPETHEVVVRLWYFIYQRRTRWWCVSGSLQKNSKISEIPETHQVGVRLWYSIY